MTETERPECHCCAKCCTEECEGSRKSGDCEHLCSCRQDRMLDRLHARLALAEKVVEAVRKYNDGNNPWHDPDGCDPILEALAAYDTATKAPDSPKETP